MQAIDALLVSTSSSLSKYVSISFILSFNTNKPLKFKCEWLVSHRIRMSWMNLVWWSLDILGSPSTSFISLQPWHHSGGMAWQVFMAYVWRYWRPQWCFYM